MCFNEWLDVLRTAIQAVGTDYYSDYPSEWIAENADERARDYWKATLAQYNERDWRYELYHQLRIALDSKKLNLPCKVRLSGESSKSATYEAITQGTRWSQKYKMPDT